MSKVQIKSLDVLSVAKMYSVICAVVLTIIGLIYLVFFAIFGVAMIGMGDGRAAGGIGLFIGAVFGLVVGIIIYAILGFIMGALMAFVYNIVAKLVGGVEMELEGIGSTSFLNPPSPPQDWGNQQQQQYNQR